MELYLDPTTKPLSENLKKWITYRQQALLSQFSGKSIMQIWNDNFGDINSSDYLQARRQAAQHIHINTFKQLGHIDIQAPSWSDLSDFYCQFVIVGYTVGILTYGLDSRQIHDMPKNLGRAYDFLQQCDDSTYRKFLGLLEWLYENDSSYYQAMHAHLLKLFEQMGKDMNNQRVAVFIMRLSFIGYLQAWLTKQGDFGNA